MNKHEGDTGLNLNLFRQLQDLGSCGLFLPQILLRVRPSLKQLGNVMRQLYFVGTRSMIIILTSGFFIGLVIALQGYNTLVQFGASESLGAVVALSLFRELGPVLTALLFTGRAGTSIAAEIGLMKATEQLDALELMAIDPIERIVLPRFIAAIIAVPLLTGMFNLLAVTGAYLFAVEWVNLDPGLFWGRMISAVDLGPDYLSGVYKSIVFGVVIALVSVFQGYNAEPTGRGVAVATTQTVIVSSILILILDFILTALLI